MSGLWMADEVDLSPEDYSKTPELTPAERRYQEITSGDLDGHKKICSRTKELVEELESSFGTPGKRIKCPECGQVIKKI